MGIVVITIPGEAQRDFTNSLHRLTGEKVDLVVIQKKRPNHNSLWNRLRRLHKSVGLLNLPIEIFYAILLRLDKKAKKVLAYFRLRSRDNLGSGVGREYLPKTLEVYSVNGTEVFNTLKNLTPELLVIWAGTIIRPEIISTAKRAINLHMGLCPHFRGAIANQNAVIKGEFGKIGATIHYAEEHVDSGDILETLTADLSKEPKDLFRDLNDRAELKYLEIAHKLYKNEPVNARTQSFEEGENMLLKYWTPKTRYNVAQKILEWEENGRLR